MTKHRIVIIVMIVIAFALPAIVWVAVEVLSVAGM